MPGTWDAKSATEIAERRWSVPVPTGDALSAVSTSAAGVTVDSEDYEGNDAVVVLSAGVVGTTGSVTVTATTTDGLVFIETFYIAVRATTDAAGDTARDVVNFALRKITGFEDEPEAAEFEATLELLNDMLAEWRIDGLDVGLSGRLAAATVLTVRDEFLSAIKYNLAIRAAEDFGREISPIVAYAAERGRTLVANVLLSMADVQFEGPLVHRRAIYY